MGKSKKKNPWKGIVNAVLSRKRAKRPYKLPKDYVLSISDNLWRTHPTKEIYYNTIMDIATYMFEKGYMRRIDDHRWFKQKQEQKFEQEFNDFKDYLSDKIACKDGSVGTFAEWQKTQAELKRVNNQKQKNGKR